MTKESDEQETTNWGKLCLIGIITILGLVAAYGGLIIWLSWPISSLSVASSGVFGDSFGLLTSLFSGLAFAGLIVTILMQREELGLQREELKLTRGVLKEQKEEFFIQNKTLKLQQFETTFFNLLALHSENISSLKHPFFRGNGPSEKAGREFFGDVLSSLVMNEIDTSLGSGGMKYIERNPIENYNIKYKVYSQRLDQYFNILCQLILIVDQNAYIDQRNKYTDIVKALLSPDELMLIFFHCLSEYGKNKLKPLVEKYAMLEYLQYNENIFDLLCEYELEAFGDNDYLMLKHDDSLLGRS